MPFDALRASILTLGDHVGTSGAPRGGILARLDNPGGPWEQQDGFEVVVRKILFDFGVILGPVYINLLLSGNLEFHFLLGLVSRSLCY